MRKHNEVQEMSKRCFKNNYA